MSNEEDDAIFVRNFSLVLIFLVVVGIAAFILAKIVNASFQQTQNNDVVVAERLAPVGSVNVDEPFVLANAEGDSGAASAPTAAASAAPSDPGTATYGKICFACHDAGVGGAPKIGDKAAWSDRMQKGTEMLVSNAINGMTGDAGIMPPKGGLPSLSDDDVRAAVMHMLDKLEEGAAPTTPAATQTPIEAAPTMEPVAAAAAAAPPPAADGRGKEVYDAACFICHATGVAGAPKIGDSTGWAPRVALGNDTLYKHAIEGFMGETGLMPPKGGRMDFSDDDVKAAVDYMLTNSQ